MHPPPGHILLPNLRKLSIVTVSAGDAALPNFYVAVSMFVHPGLVAFDISSSSPNAMFVLGLLTQLQLHCSEIEQLTITGISTDPSPIITAFSHLRTLSCHSTVPGSLPLTERSLRGLSSLPHLESWVSNLIFDPSSCPAKPTDPKLNQLSLSTSCFQSLQRLELLYVSDLQALSRCLSHISSTSVRYIRAHYSLTASNQKDTMQLHLETGSGYISQGVGYSATIGRLGNS